MMTEIRNFCDRGNKLHYMKRELSRQHSLIKNHITSSQNKKNTNEKIIIISLFIYLTKREILYIFNHLLLHKNQQ